MSLVHVHLHSFFLHPSPKVVEALEHTSLLVVLLVLLQQNAFDRVHGLALLAVGFLLDVQEHISQPLLHLDLVLKETVDL